MSALSPDDFDAFFREVHEVAPFDWQRRLARAVCATGWPDTLDVPTGAGKTAVIDIAVFHLALEADRGAARRAPVRMFFLVDRRLIVDAAHDRAVRIATALARAGDGVVARVAGRLRLLAEDPRRPLAVARLRGGVPKDPDWVRTPAQPTVITSTIDQAGSRLLFRGYGVSNAMKPLHAGLVGADALLLLDEAHLSRPFLQTARDARPFQERGPWSADAAPAPFRIVSLSATPPSAHAGAAPFVLSDAERADPKLAARLVVPKAAELIAVAEPAGSTAFAAAFVENAWSMSRAGGVGGAARVVAVVVNRVRRARAIFEQLLAEEGVRPFGTDVPDAGASEPATAEVALLTGRIRELDREALVEMLLARIAASRDRAQDATRPPLFVVATQSIEAGADLDVDAMVTEIAPLDCLRQRFGRLDRLGASGNARAAILAAKDQTAKRADDPIYGTAARETWTLLDELAKAGRKGGPKTIDFGIVPSRAWMPAGDALAACVAPRPDAPVLLPRDLDFWTRTSPVPAVDPEVALYLHGPSSGAEVGLVWRADLDDGLPPAEWIERLRVCPPASAEVLVLPIAEARAWLSGKGQRGRLGDIPDLAGVPDEADDRAADARAPLRAVRWRGVHDTPATFLDPDKLRPGDVVVVSAAAGGCDRWGWNPGSEAPVADLGRAANRRQRGRDVLRLSPADLARKPEQIATRLDELVDESDARVVEMFEAELADPIDGYRIVARPRVLRDGGGRPRAIERRIERHDGTPAAEAVTEDDDSLRAPAAVMLSDHARHVEALARRSAEALGLPAELVADIALAARLHDAGKAHPAVQRLLRGGGELGAGGTPLAKSGRLPTSPAAWRLACARAGLPPGARHEVASLFLAERDPDVAALTDERKDLVLWLIGTHHGHGRPFFPAVAWPQPNSDAAGAFPARPLAALTAAWIDLAGRVQRRFGPWGLARLEAILRLADHRASEAAQASADEAERREAAQ